MALNATSHMIPPEKGDQAGNQTVPLASENTKNPLLKGSTSEPIDQSISASNTENSFGGKKPKTERELKKEREKAEKQKKFEEKKAKQKANGVAPVTKPKESKKTANKLQVPEYVEPTPKGQKKLLQPLDDTFHKAYLPKVVESAWYDWWEAQGYLQPEFTADGNVKPAGSFVIVIPPPNVTGALHCGHALATALQDTMIRWYRMRGFTTLYLPGCDHAGISTQSVVENMLRRRQHKTRHDLGRTKFVETVQIWKEEYHAKINAVLRRLGASLDWTREAFTMDANLSTAVTETFVRLHDEGYIYRENRLVNWCTALNTALSNLEVDNKELEGTTKLDVPGYQRKIEFGSIWHFKYPIEGSQETIEVATTRPETMLGDTAVAVHPTDNRYQHLIGMNVRHPFIPDRKIPIIGDEYADPEKGTGAVKITPAHDPNDFKVGKKHSLEFINILNDDGSLNSNAGNFQGQKRFDARYNVIAELDKKGLFVKKENNAMTVPLCAKSKDVIEPLMKPQWWMKMRELADAAIKVVKDGEIKIRPKSEEKAYYRWMENIDDWCLSRQLWWGHQIPAYLVKVDGETPDEAAGDSFVVGRTLQEAQQKAEAKFPNQTFTLHRDEDVLDTWFSSGLWPFSTLGWPRNTSDLQKLYPTSVLETGWDILFFWVARMIIFGVKLTGKIPFTEVYCHTLIRDSEGRKMSKSLGNVIDPIDMMEGIDLKTLHEKLYLGNLDPKEIKQAEKYQKTAFPDGIAECGTDALRFALVHYTTGGEDIKFDIKVIVAYRHFCNKIYQATKFVLGNIGSDFVPAKQMRKHGNESLAEAWILSKLTTAADEMNRALDQREFAKSTQIAYQYWYDHLCDVFIENSKAIIRDGTEQERQSATNTLYSAIEFGLLLLHPMMPFITEELWQRLPRRPGDTTESIMIAKYPSYDEQLLDADSEKNYETVLAAAKGIRNLLAENNLSVAPAGNFKKEMMSLLTLSNCKRLGYTIEVSENMPMKSRAFYDCDTGEDAMVRIFLL